MSQSTYNILASTDEATVVSEYTPSPSTSESYQSEADLEREFIALLTRQGYEYMTKPCRLEGEEGFIYYHLPVTSGGDTLESPEAVAGTYLAMLDEKMDKIIHSIMDAKSNVLYFCGAGKDSTGVVSAIFLKKLGCSDQIIIEDYMETKDNLMGFLTSYVAEHLDVDINAI